MRVARGVVAVKGRGCCARKRAKVMESPAQMKFYWRIRAHRRIVTNVLSAPAAFRHVATSQMRRARQQEARG
ncbi:hypothetical protein COLSTE_00660 [Collinsella stercoris DSM 13279]|uniref:Uncharacterized protein n=1 Tax=Collinsella stercoris DSM 13279 TaxID=445975 RepID=B6G9B9_9ACTN|nr:hypothetical protein COLSTE_00660 [Collinsella stercoris DSM 13279]